MTNFDTIVFSQRVETLIELVLSNKQPSHLFEAMKYSALGGKHLRALLCYAVSVDLIDAGQIEPMPSLECINQTHSNNSYQFHPSDAIALAVELIHSYSLVHDDLPAMDDDAIRRNKPSTHKAYGEATAILVGDGLQAYAFEILSYGNFDTATFKTIVNHFSKAIGSMGMVAGQMLDIESKNLSNENEIIQMYQLKTAKLITSSIVLPFLCVKKFDQSNQNILKIIGNDLGLSFQIQDDLLEKSGADIGKPIDSDLRNQKNTILNHLPLTKLQKMQEQLTKKMNKNLNQLSFDTKNLGALIANICQRGY